MTIKKRSHDHHDDEDGGKFHYFHNFFTFLLILSLIGFMRKKSWDFNILSFLFIPSFLQSECFKGYEIRVADVNSEKFHVESTTLLSIFIMLPSDSIQHQRASDSVWMPLSAM